MFKFWARCLAIFSGTSVYTSFLDMNTRSAADYLWIWTNNASGFQTRDFPCVCLHGVCVCVYVSVILLRPLSLSTSVRRLTLYVCQRAPTEVSCDCVDVRGITSLHTWNPQEEWPTPPQSSALVNMVILILLTEFRPDTQQCRHTAV
jgi:hypothetical protein